MTAPSCAKSLVLFVVVLLFLPACGSVPVAQTAPASPIVASAPSTVSPTHIPAQTNQASAAAVTSATATVKVAVLPFFSFAPFFIAQDEGYFAEQGIKIEVVKLPGQAQILPALLSGQVDVGSGLISAGILTTIAKGGKFQIVADKGYAPATGCDSYALVVRRGLVQTGVIQHPEQLRGGTASLLPTSWLNYYAEKAMNKAGLKMEDLRQVELGTAPQLEALNKGQVDLIGNNEPWITRYTQAGHQTIFTPAHELLPDSQSAITLYGPNLLGKNIDVGNRFMVAYLKAVRQYNQGKTDRNIAIMSKAVQLDVSTLKQMCWQPIRVDGRINVQSILDFQQWAMDKKLMTTAVTPEQFWNPSFVDYANKQLGPVAQ